MRALGRKPEGLRLERIRASPQWAGDAFANAAPILPGLRDTLAPAALPKGFPWPLD
jgi:hypothetical protein